MVIFDSMDIAVIKTPLGNLQIEGSQKGLVAVKFLNDSALLTEVIPESLEKAAMQLQEYFLKNRTTFTCDLDLKGTDFQKRVWSELYKLPYGITTNYLAMAKKLGNPKVIRAAASANGKNPISIIIPCHRVIGSDGSLTGYAGGLHRKKWLLEHESVVTQGRLF